MNTLLDSLSEILKEIVENYSLLLDIFQRERRFIIENSLHKLHDCIKQKETMVIKIKMLEDSRLSITDKLSDLFHVKSGDMTLSYLSDSTSEPYSSVFKNYRSKLLSLVQSIRDVNRENKNFIEMSMDTIRESFKFLNDATNPRPTYLSSGAVHSQVQRGRMVKVMS
ncbi:MAG: flagellar protein FlgN, partial [Nitrospinae bacterium]|nr:flagellar protein FlgN [Nitrospinota bacterium]